MRLALTLAAIVGLAACGEKPQTGGGVKGDTAAFQGGGNSFNAPDWKVGDKAAWEQHLKARAQNSQNEYNRVK